MDWHNQLLRFLLVLVIVLFEEVTSNIEDEGFDHYNTFEEIYKPLDVCIK